MDAPLERFVVFLIAFVVLFALLNYLAALCLGPVAEAVGSEPS